MKTFNYTNRSSAYSCERSHGLRCLVMSSVFILFGISSSCGGGGGGGGDPCANTLNIEGDWFFTSTITSISGDCGDLNPGDTGTDSGFITQEGRAITFLWDDQKDPYLGTVCGNNMNLYLFDCFIGKQCITEDWYGTISADTNTITGYGYFDRSDYLTGDVICSAQFDWSGSRSFLIGAGDGRDGAFVFNYDDEASALIFARSTDSNPPSTQILGTVLPREGGDFSLPSGYWDLYMTYPGEHSRISELAR